MSLEYRSDEAGISTTIIEEVSALDVIFLCSFKRAE